MPHPISSPPHRCHHLYDHLVNTAILSFRHAAATFPPPSPLTSSPSSSLPPFPLVAALLHRCCHLLLHPRHHPLPPSPSSALPPHHRSSRPRRRRSSLSPSMPHPISSPPRRCHHLSDHLVNTAILSFRRAAATFPPPSPLTSPPSSSLPPFPLVAALLHRRCHLLLHPRHHPLRHYRHQPLSLLHHCHRPPLSLTRLLRPYPRLCRHQSSPTLLICARSPPVRQRLQRCTPSTAPP